MTTLRLLKVATPSFPVLDRAAPIARLAVDGPSEQDFFEDNLQLAREVGDRSITRALSRCLLRYRLRHWLADVDQLLFSGKTKQLFSHFKRTA
jgi:hypothetical protein